MDMTAQDLVVTLIDDRPDRIVATGDVRLRGSNLGGRGDEAVYVRSTETLILSGEDAEVSDSETGVVRGRRFDIDFERNIVTVTSESGERVVSRRALNPE
jgi:lipopolysaccharide export system protein LptA